MKKRTKFPMFPNELVDFKKDIKATKSSLTAPEDQIMHKNSNLKKQKHTSTKLRKTFDIV